MLRVMRGPRCHSGSRVGDPVRKVSVGDFCVSSAKASHAAGSVLVGVDGSPA
jgi:hypothetical protein